MYEQLTTVFEVIQAKGMKVIEMMRDIDTAYNKCESEEWYENSGSVKNFDMLLKKIPNKMWVE